MGTLLVAVLSNELFDSTAIQSTLYRVYEKELKSLPFYY